MNFYLIIAVGVVVVLILLYFILTFNSFKRLNNDIKEAFATMDVYLKKRWDLIPNLMETVKGYAKHEKDTLKEIVDLRNNTYNTMNTEEKIEKNELMSRNIAKLMALAENYPDLKANENFLNLSNELSNIEDEIAQSRKYYNAVVRKYNNKVEMIPSNIIASILGYKTKLMFEASDEEKNNVKVKLNG